MPRYDMDARRRRAMFYYMRQRDAEKRGRRRGAAAGIAGTLTGVAGGFAIRDKFNDALKKSRLNKEFDEGLANPFNPPKRWTLHYSGKTPKATIPERALYQGAQRLWKMWLAMPPEQRIRIAKRLANTVEIVEGNMIKYENFKDRVRAALGLPPSPSRIRKIARRTVADAARDMTRRAGNASYRIGKAMRVLT